MPKIELSEACLLSPCACQEVQNSEAWITESRRVEVSSQPCYPNQFLLFRQVSRTWNRPIPCWWSTYWCQRWQIWRVPSIAIKNTAKMHLIYVQNWFSTLIFFSQEWKIKSSQTNQTVSPLFFWVWQCSSTRLTASSPNYSHFKSAHVRI